MFGIGKIQTVFLDVGEPLILIPFQFKHFM
jgi:hypothetical protein